MDVSELKLLIKPHITPTLWRVKSYIGHWIFGRVACLGADVLKLLNLRPPVFNVQKGRVDYLLGGLNNAGFAAQPLKVSTHMSRRDILPLIAQEADFTWASLRPPTAVFMDSYSELTDQLFVHKTEKWGFCSNYSDLNHSVDFLRKFSEEGLLPQDGILDVYRDFFRVIRGLWGKVPIYFLHFPVKLDNREKFKARYKEIYAAATVLAKEIPGFYSLDIDEGIVGWPETKISGLENFPYHYNNETYRVFAEKVRQVGYL